MKISSDSSALLLTHEGITNFASLSDFEKKNIENFSSVSKKSIPDIQADASNSFWVEDSDDEANISSILVSRFITSFNYESIMVTFPGQRVPKAWAMWAS